MKKLFDKIKSLDKKILIGGSVGIVALIIAVVVILVVCLGGKDTENDKTDDTTYTNDEVEKEEEKEETNETDETEEETKEEATFTVKVVDAEGNPVAGVTVQVCKEECIPATSDDTGVATFNLEITEGYKLSVVTCPEGYEYTGEAEIALEAGITEYELTVQKKTENTDGGNTVTQQPSTTNPSGDEILGAGSKNQPYLETPNLSNMTLTTVSIPAGKTLYYGIYRVGNMILTINDANAYVIESDGTRHNASGGKVSFKVEDALASDYVLLQIGNNSSSAKSFTIKFSNPTGSQMNPTILSSLGSEYQASVKANEQQGYFYKYTAQQTGTIRFYLKSADCVVRVTNNTTMKQEVVETNGGYVDLPVSQGDEISINVARTDYSAGTIVWSAQFN